MSPCLRTEWFTGRNGNGEIITFDQAYSSGLNPLKAIYGCVPDKEAWNKFNQPCWLRYKPVQTVFRRCKRNEGLRNNKFRDRITIIALCIRVEELSLIAMHLYFTAQFETTKVNSLSGNQEIPSLYILLIKLIYLISLFSHTFVTPLQENNTLRRN